LHTWLIVVYALLIVYASLSPFTGWRNQGLSFGDVLGMPLRLTYTPFDATVNLLAYLPFGLLVCLVLRLRSGAAASVAFALCAGVLLSACMEYLQMYLPTRTSSNTDLLSNSAGTLIGSLLAIAMTSQTRLIAKLTRWRNGFFNQGKETDFGLALLVLWMFGQINPSLPMLGNIFISEAARQPFVKLAPAPFNWWACGAATLNLLMLGTLMLTLLRIRRQAVSVSLGVLGAVALAKFCAAALLLKSWALLLWINGEAMLGILIGILLLLIMVRLPRTVASALGAAIALIYLAIVNLIMDNSVPPARATLYYWHYGHVLTYNGLAQTITLAFPILLLFHMWRARKV
jgi:VanZ family protein